VERSFRAKDLATQLLLRLNPKREAAASIHRAPSPNRACGPALKVLCIGGEEPPQQGETLWLRLL